MKLFVSVLILFASLPAFAAEQYLSCRVTMDQFHSSSGMFPLIGDSNQRFEIHMKDDGHGKLRGEAQVRFLNDQSADGTNSLHGARAIAVYAEGNGLVVSMQVLKFSDKTDQSKSEPVAALAGFASFEKSLKDGAGEMEFAYVNPKAYDPDLDLWTLFRAGQVVNYELRTVAFQGCFHSIR